MAGERLLIVDDESQIRQIFGDYFSSLGYRVVVAENGRDALEIFAHGDFDCVLSDLVMPVMNGMEFLRALREEDKETAFFLMTGYPSVGSTVDAIKLGAYDYITKPLNLEDVRIKVERAVHARDAEKSLKKTQGLLWSIVISVPLWLTLGVMLGFVWGRF
jgi:two-component system, NtrC family, response regulator AtoC